jgi:mannose-6-phosphate isomerase-like protein (cupin superfamily)
MSTRCAGVILLVAGFAARGDAQRPAATADSAQIAALEQQIEDAVVRRDTTFLERAYAPTFRFKHSSGVLEDRGIRIQSMRAVPRAGASQMVERRVDSIDVEVHGDLALSTGRIHIRRNGAWSPTRDYTIRYARIYARGAGGWQLVTHHSTDQTYDLVATAPPKKPSPNLSTGSMIETDSMIAKREPGPHKGTGETTAYSFFAKVRDLPLVFRKRALHPGASIGYHEQKEDEIYYVLSGQGELTLDSTRYAVGPGTAILTRPGSSHGIRQVGRDDLVLLISYPSERASQRAERAENTGARP